MRSSSMQDRHIQTPVWVPRHVATEGAYVWIFLCWYQHWINYRVVSGRTSDVKHCVAHEYGFAAATPDGICQKVNNVVKEKRKPYRTGENGKV